METIIIVILASMVMYGGIFIHNQRTIIKSLIKALSVFMVEHSLSEIEKTVKNTNGAEHD